MAAVDDRATVGFHLLVAPDRDAVRAVAREALAREADEIALAAHAGAAWDGWSAVPVTA